MSNKVKVIQKTLEILASEPQGLRYSELARRLIESLSDVPKNTIHGTIWNIQTIEPQIDHPARGLFKHIKYKQDVGQTLDPTQAALPKNVKSVSLREEDFYELFGNYLKGELNEVNRVVALGGAGLKVKWGTPDVVGIYKPSGSDLVKFDPEIVSAEIKVDPYQSIYAFGQAAAYRLFSNRVYIVMPSTIPRDDLDRLEALCMLFGIGLVLFDINIQEPGFVIRVRSQRFQPDMFYVNEFAQGLHKHNKERFEELFG